MKKTISVLGHETVWQGKFLRMQIIRIEELYAGNTLVKTREMAVRQHRVACILPVTRKNELVLIRQPRIYYNQDQEPEIRITLEFPAGKVGDNQGQEDEELEAAARRELAEETGYVADQLHFLFKESVSAGALSEERFCFFADGVRLGKKEESAESDQIEVLLVPVREARTFIREETARGVEIDSGIRSMLFEVIASLEARQNGSY